jgi:hypothetical protein
MFNLFAETLDGMPPPAVRHFIGRIHATFEDALLYKRIDETRDVHSILCFCQFMDSMFENDVIFPVGGLPVEHVAFYRKVVSRLIEASELPAEAEIKFDAAFSSGFLKSLTTCQMMLSEDLLMVVRQDH